MLKGWWAGKTKARLAAKASGAIGELSKEIGREAMLPAAVEAWNSYYSCTRTDTGTRTIE